MIKYAELDLSKDLIVLCGPNNTGKTYAAYCVYKAFTSKGETRELSKPNKNLMILHSHGFGVGNFFGNYFEEVSSRISELALAEIDPFFSTPFGTFKDARIELTFSQEDVEKLSSASFDSEGDIDDQPFLWVNLENEGRWELNLEGGNELEGFTNREWVPLRKYLWVIVSTLLFPVKTIIEPIERISINVFAKELAQARWALVDQDYRLKGVYSGNKRIGKVPPVAVARYPVPVRDAMDRTLRLDLTIKKIGPLSLLADEVEQELLKGKVSVSEFGEVSFVPTGMGNSIGIHITGSVVKALANLVFYLRHEASPGDLYIIDEPELTLHPDNQRKMARILARMVNAGIKVIMSTHSDYIIRELNNLMMLHTDRNPQKVEELMAKYGYAKDDLLDHKRVGAYMFTKDVAPIEVTEIGFEVDTIDNEINQQNNSSMEIFMDLHE